MKRLTALLLCVVLGVSLMACGAEPAAPAADAAIPDAAPAPAESGAQPESGGKIFEGKEITVGVWGGNFANNIQTCFVDPFVEDTGATVILEEYGNDLSAKIRAQYEQDIPGYDLVSGLGTTDTLWVCAEAGALQPIDYSRLKSADNIMEDVKYEYGIGAYASSIHPVYLADKFPNGGPTNAVEYFDLEKFPGNRSMISYVPTQTFELALLGDGVAREDLYPLDIDRALKSLDRIKGSITKWWGSGADIMQALNDREVDAGYFWPGYAYKVKDSGVNVEVGFDDVLMNVDAWSIPTNARNVDVVYAFLDYCCDPELAAKFSIQSGYGPVITTAFDYMTEEQANRMATSPQNIDGAIWVNVEWWEQNFKEAERRYLEWLAG